MDACGSSLLHSGCCMHDRHCIFSDIAAADAIWLTQLQVSSQSSRRMSCCHACVLTCCHACSPAAMRAHLLPCVLTCCHVCSPAAPPRLCRHDSPMKVAYMDQETDEFQARVAAKLAVSGTAGWLHA
jgi:hypothetical protein